MTFSEGWSLVYPDTWWRRELELPEVQHWQVHYGFLLMQLTHSQLVHLESWRRYVAMSHMVGESGKARSLRQRHAWVEAQLCRAEMERMEALER